MKTTFETFTCRSVGTEAEFSAWLASAEPDAAIQYHDGFLAFDIGNDAPRFGTPGQAELIRIARLARSASEQRLVHLVQRRLAPNRCAYLAIMRLAAARQPDGDRRGHQREAPAGAKAGAPPPHGCTLASFLDLAGDIERLPVDVLVNGSGENRLILRQRAARLSERISEIIGRASL
jgi:hypothetical protein